LSPTKFTIGGINFLVLYNILTSNVHRNVQHLYGNVQICTFYITDRFRKRCLHFFKWGAEVIKNNRVVITGLGVLAANGIGKEEFWRTLIAGESGIGPITLFDASEFKSRIAGEIKNFHGDDLMDGRIKARRLSRNVKIGVAAAEMAIKDAGLNKKILKDASPVPVIIGISLGGFDHIETQIRKIVKMGPNRVLPSSVEACIHLATASLIGAVIDVPAEISTLSNSCVGGLDAIAAGAELIKFGKAEVVICGGTEAPICPAAMAGFCAAGMVSQNNENPSTASRPFDLNRDGGILAEGSGIVILESLDHALWRNAACYAEIIGYGTARNVIDGVPGNGFELSMRKTINNAGLMPCDIDYISAHGPSDVVIDQSETEMIKRVFGSQAYSVPVSSIKAVTGNPLAAGGALQVISAALAIQHKLIPPTGNYTTPDPGCDLDYVVEGAREIDVRHILINSHGSGENNSSMIISQVER